MKNYQGIIIEESLADKSVLKKLKIISTEVEKVTAEDQTPWLEQWTLQTVEIPEREAAAIAEEISRSLDYSHHSSWYADFKNDRHHYVIFRDKVFFIDRQSQEQYDAAKAYGVSLGIPVYQLDFQPELLAH